MTVETVRLIYNPLNQSHSHSHSHGHQTRTIPPGSSLVSPPYRLHEGEWGIGNGEWEMGAPPIVQSHRLTVFIPRTGGTVQRGSESFEWFSYRGVSVSVRLSASAPYSTCSGRREEAHGWKSECMAGVKLLSRLVSQHHDSARVGVRVIDRERMAAIQRNTEKPRNREREIEMDRQTERPKDRKTDSNRQSALQQTRAYRNLPQTASYTQGVITIILLVIITTNHWQTVSVIHAESNGGQNQFPELPRISRARRILLSFPPLLLFPSFLPSPSLSSSLLLSYLSPTSLYLSTSLPLLNSSLLKQFGFSLFLLFPLLPFCSLFRFLLFSFSFSLFFFAHTNPPSPPKRAFH